MHVLLERFAYMPMGTLGRLIIDGSNGFFTVERPWLDNKAFESCQSIKFVPKYNPSVFCKNKNNS
jgi:hypothetical protein